MKKLIVLTRHDKLGSSSRLRFIDLFQHLSKDFKIEHNSLLSDKYIETLYSNDNSWNKKYKITKYAIEGYASRVKFLFSVVFKNDEKIIWIEKEIFPYFPYWIERHVLRQNKFILDYDDAIYERYNENRNFLIKRILGKKIKKLMESATIVIVGNKILKKYAENANAKKIIEIPTLIDEKKISNHSKYKIKSKIIIGWIGTQASVTELIPLINLIIKSELNKMVKFKIIGAKIHVTNAEIECIKWNSDKDIESLEDIDIGVMPLAKDRFNEGKCAYKLLQYLACGKPVIATPWGMNIDVIHDEKIGFLADNNSEWLNQIKYYIDNKKIVDMHSDYRKDIIKKNYTISSKIDSIKEILKNCN